MVRKIALVTITAAALAAPPSLVHALTGTNGNNLNGMTLNGLTLNGLTLNGDGVNGIRAHGVEPTSREVYFVGEQAGGESTVLTIELPRVTR